LLDQVRLLFEAAAIGVVVTGRDGRIVLVNPALQAMFGYASGEVIGQSIEMLLPEGLRAHHSAYRATYLRAPHARPMGQGQDLWGRRKDGQLFPIEVSLSMLELSDGPVALAFVVDISARRAAETARLASEAMNRAVLGSLTAHIAVLDADGTIVAVNAAWERFARANGGVAPTSLGAGVSYLAVCRAAAAAGDSLAAAALAGIAAVLSGEQPAFTLEYPCHGPAQERWFVMHVTPLEDHPGVVVAHENITERKHGEETRAQLAAIVGSSDDAIIGKALDGTIVTWNAGAERLYGYSAAEAIGQPMAMLIPPDRLAIVGDIMQRTAQGERVAHFDNVCLHKDGRRIDVSMSYSPIVDAAGRIIGASTIGRDISERMRAEQRLRQKTMFVQLLQEIAIAANQATSIDAALRTAIAQICMHIGWPVGHVYLTRDGQAPALVSTDIWYLADPDRFAVFRAITEALSVASSGDLVERVRMRGKAEWVTDLTAFHDMPRASLISDVGICAGFAFPVLVGAEVVAVLEFFATAPRELDAALLDVMAHVGAQLGRVIERAHAERSLREREERYRLIAENTSDLIQIFDHAGRFTYASPSHAHVLGVDPIELIGARPEDLTHPDDQAALCERWNDLIAKPGTAHATFRARHVDGSWRWIEASVTATQWQGANCIVSVARDVTERRQAEEQLRRLSQAVEQSTSTIVITDTHGYIEYANPAFAKTTGYTITEALGQHTRIFKSGRTSPEAYRQLWETITSGNEWRGEFRNKKKNGELYWESAVISPIKNAEGVITSFLAVKEDITARKRAEADLRVAEARYSTLIEQIPAIIYTANIDATSSTRYVSPQIEAILGFTPAEWLADPELWLKQIHPDDRASVLADVERAQTSDTPVPAEYRSFTRDGRIVWLRDAARVVRDEAGTPLFMQGITLDITERKRIEAALIEERALLARRVEERTADLSVANAELARAARLKDEFLSSMSHELRTPLNAVLGLSEALREETYGALNDQQDRALQTIAESGQHLLALINDILDLAKIGAGKLELEREPLDVSTICQASLRLVKQAAMNKRIAIESAIDPAVNSLQADGRRLKQILVNLLSNAVKFTSESGRVGLEVRGDAARHSVDFTVWDTGIGIAPEHLNRLFQPFVQLDSRLARQYEGTGLGLALVYRMAEMHGGGVSVSSELGVGSRFTVSLPWQAAGTVLPNNEAERAGAVVGTIRRALIIEDSPAAAEQVARYLGEVGIVTTTLTEGRAALAHAVETQPDLILLDILLPDTSGWDVLTRLKTDPRTHAIPVVIVSVVDERTYGLALGAAAYLVKPCTRDDIWAMLRQIVGPGPGDAIGLHKAGRGSEEQLILLAEDNEANIVTVGDYLTAKGYQVVVARNGVEAVARAQERRPKLILMDIQMPGMDGLEATRCIRANADLAATPIIALTALAMPGDREKCIAAGLNDYISKPVSLKGLAAKIAAHLH
jgi:PAS domain S-box-containing protein